MPAEEPPPPATRSEDGIHLCLTHAPLSLAATVDLVRSPKAGALVMFVGASSFSLSFAPLTHLGTTRDSFDNRTVQSLAYQSYVPLALQTMHSIARDMKQRHGLLAIAVTHRLGECPVGEESIHIAVSAPHRTAAWRAGEECLEEVKRRVEVWKLEKFDDGGVWRANRDGEKGVEVKPGSEEEEGVRK